MDCSPERLRSLVSKEKVEFDADIAGPGVQAAFLITSLIALATLILAFMTHSVPSRLLNSGDAVLATVARRTCHRLRVKFLTAKRTKIIRNREERTHAFMTFMVAMCDQILVSQASILIASFIIHDSITIYSAKIIIALSFLASTVHLGSLPFYMDRLKGHGTAKLIRVLTVATCSGMLMFLLIVRLSFTWNMATHVYFTCTLQDYRMQEKMDATDVFILVIQMFPPLAVLYGTYETIQLLYREQPTDDKSNGVAAKRHNHSINPQGDAGDLRPQEQSVIGAMDLQTLRRLEEQATTDNHRDLSDIEIESRAIRSILDHISVGGMHSSQGREIEYRHQRSILFKPRSAKMKFKEVMREIRESNRESLLNKWLTFKSLSILTSDVTSPRKLRLLVTLVAETWSFHQCRGSFVWRLFWLWSGNIYGIVTIFVSRAVTTGMSGNPNKMGFGQVVPLTLLALPILVAMEGHADYKKKLRSIAKARINEANLESSADISTRSNSIGQIPEHRRDIPMQTDSTSIRTIKEILKKRSQDIGHPELYSWLLEDNLTNSPMLQKGAVAHAAMMFVVTTSLGLFIAYPVYGIEFAMTSIFLLFAARRLIGLVLVVSDMRSCPVIIDHLGCKQRVYNTENGNSGEITVMSPEAGNSGQNNRQEEA
ncbi:hypothetical protein FDENT_4063 [Fusarium denticulatum]|uniref:Uncharacterized protein n=1 Tax=Fusarium denticulatum TaxID=48507 RepID=A0A8H5UIC5_9HYPO|nr:hypothetical protein FDENT_4063 [Fusarium denticulatum]